MRNYIFYGTLIVSLCFFNVSLTAKDVLAPTKVGNFNILDPIIQELSVSKVDVIIIDAGHGGYDGGTSGAHASKEKDITLRLALLVGKSIQDRFPDLKIIYTRKTDVFVPLSERARIANEAHADLFISIHCNAMPPSAKGRLIKGSETYVLGATKKEKNLLIAKRENETIFLETGHAEYNFTDPDSPEWHIFMSMYQQNYLERSIEFANMVEKKFKTYGKRKSRGVLQNNFHVLREVAMPSVLIETGYLSNHEDETYLKSKAGQNKIVQAISDAFYEYKTGIEVDIQKTAIAYQAPETPIEESPVQAIDKEISKEEKTNKPTVLAENTTQIPKPRIKRKKKKKEAKHPPKPVIKRQQKKPVKVKVERTYETIKPVSSVNESKIIAVSVGQEKPSEVKRPIPKRKPKKKKKLVDIKNLAMSPVFKIQIAASKSPINVKSKKYAQLSNVEVVYEAGYFKYLTGHTRHWTDITSVFKVLKNKGFKGFIVAYLNGHRIGLAEARNMAGN